MEARFLHESEARASSWGLPVAREMTFADAPHQGGTFSDGQGLNNAYLHRYTGQHCKRAFPGPKASRSQMGVRPARSND